MLVIIPVPSGLAPCPFSSTSLLLLGTQYRVQFNRFPASRCFPLHLPWLPVMTFLTLALELSLFFLTLIAAVGCSKTTEKQLELVCAMLVSLRQSLKQYVSLGFSLGIHNSLCPTQSRPSAKPFIFHGHVVRQPGRILSLLIRCWSSRRTNKHLLLLTLAMV
jgi:hypothetical protein